MFPVSITFRLRKSSVGYPFDLFSILHWLGFLRSFGLLLFSGRVCMTGLAVIV